MEEKKYTEKEFLNKLKAMEESYKMKYEMLEKEMKKKVKKEALEEYNKGLIENSQLVKTLNQTINNQRIELGRFNRLWNKEKRGEMYGN